jgi:membrane protein implicated in regulation of membrane protease activity
MAEYFSTLQFWHWWVLALILVIIEMIAPGFFLLWIGIAAGITGLVMFILGEAIGVALSWQVQFLIFGVLAVASVVAAKYYIRSNPIETEDATLNRRGEQYIGRVLSLDEGIVNGIGKVRVGDSVWRAQGPDLPAGERVKVVGVDGTMLKVEKA